MSKLINVPSEIKDITLGQYMDVMSHEDITDEQLISILCNISLDKVRELPADTYDTVLSILVDVTNKLQDEQPLTMRFKLNGREYGMIPNFDKITYGENKDLSSYLQNWNTMDRAMAVLFRQVDATYNDTYRIVKYSGTSNHITMRQMPLDIVLGSQIFFYSLTRELLKAIPNYLEREVKRLPKEQMQQASSKEIGEAMRRCIVSLRETLGDLRK